MDYGNLFSRAWSIVWNNKFLWVLGFLAALGGSSGGGPSFRFDIDRLRFDMPQFEPILDRFLPIFIALICVGFFVGLILWLVRLVAEAGLISAAAHLDHGEKVTLSQSLSAGAAVLGRFIAVNLLLYGPFVLAILVIVFLIVATVGMSAFDILSRGEADPRVLVATLGPLFLCLIPLICLMVPVGVIITGIYTFAQRAIVLDNLGVIASIGHGWQVLRRNIVEIIIIAILLLIIGWLFGILLGLILTPIAVLLAAPTFFGLMARGTLEVGAVLFAAIGAFVLGLIGALLFSVLRAFQSTTVTLAYEVFAGRKPKAATVPS